MNQQYITRTIDGGTLPEVTITGRSSGGWMDVITNVLKTVVGGISGPNVTQQPGYNAGSNIPNTGGNTGGNNTMVIVLLVVLILIVTKSIKL